MRIFAHRGLWNTKEEKNTLRAMEYALQEGFDLETDIRIWRGNFVIKHDLPLKDEKVPSLIDLLSILKKYKDNRVAFHFKYNDWKNPGSLEIVNMLKPFADRVFLFDMSLDYCLTLKEKNKNIKVGVSVGDKKYHDAFCDLEDALRSEIDIIWADEYRSFYSRKLIDKCREYKKIVYCISPDLASAVDHPRALKGYQETWKNLRKWGADGICTDQPRELKKLIKNNYANRNSSSRQR